jgi:hypothetical protein
MFGIWGTRGTIGRTSFVVRLLLFPAFTLFGTVFVLAVWSLSGGDPGDWWVADFVRRYLGWICDGWTPLAVVLACFLLGARVMLCAYVKRARDIGVEIPSISAIPRFFFVEGSRATLRDLLIRRSTTKFSG